MPAETAAEMTAGPQRSGRLSLLLAMAMFVLVVDTSMMTLTHSIVPIIIFWAIIGGLGASLLLPAMQSLIHGNFEGAVQKQAYAAVGAATRIAAAVGQLLGDFIRGHVAGAGENSVRYLVTLRCRQEDAGGVGQGMAVFR